MGPGSARSGTRGESEVGAGSGDLGECHLDPRLDVLFLAFLDKGKITGTTLR